LRRGLYSAAASRLVLMGEQLYAALKRRSSTVLRALVVDPPRRG
jgi:hypothetical protein